MLVATIATLLCDAVVFDRGGDCCALIRRFYVSFAWLACAESVLEGSLPRCLSDCPIHSLFVHGSSTTLPTHLHLEGGVELCDTDSGSGLRGEAVISHSLLKAFPLPSGHASLSSRPSMLTKNQLT